MRYGLTWIILQQQLGLTGIGKMKDVRNFTLHKCILIFDTEQVYLKLQVTNLKNKEVTVNPKPQTLEKSWFFDNPIPYTLNSKP